MKSAMENKMIDAGDVYQLEAKGYKVVEQHIYDNGGHIVVADPVQCSSGGKRWTEYENVTLRDSSGVYRFILERS